MEIGEGAKLKQDMIDGGAPVTEVEAWASGLREEMIRGGAPQPDVARYWGDPVEPPLGRMQSMVRANFGRLTPDESQRAANDATEALYAGFQYSDTGLIVRGRKPDLVLPQDAGLWQKVTFGLGMAGGDLPFNIAGGAVGRLAGAPLGPAGMVLGMGAGSAALPAIVREVLMDQYTHPDGVKDWGEFWGRFAHVVKEVGIETFTGAASMLIGGAIGKRALDATGSKVFGTITGLSSMAVSATAIGGGLRGHVPDWDDFAAGTILALGLHATGTMIGPKGRERFVPNATGEKAMQNLADIYTSTGIDPMQAVRMAASGDLALRAEILEPRNAAGERHTPAFDALRPTEPENAYPYKPTINAKALEEATPLPKPDAEGNVPPRELSPVEAVERTMIDAVDGVDVAPETLQRYGLRSDQMSDPVYRENAQRVILADLQQKYTNDTQDVLLAYRAGVERTDAWIAGGRDFAELPVEHQRFLQKMEAEGALDRGYNAAIDAMKESLAGLRSPDKNFPFSKATEMARQFYFDWHGAGRDPNNIVSRVLDDGTRIPEPQAIAGYLQEFGRRAGFLFQVVPAYAVDPRTKGSVNPFNLTAKVTDTTTGKKLLDINVVNVPDNNDALMRRWHNLGRSEVLFHEVGHALDAHFNGGTDHTKTIPARVRAEVIEASKSLRTHSWATASTDSFKRYLNSSTELMADAIAVWLSNPTMRARMPEFGKLYGQKLQEYVELAEQYLPRRVGENPETGQAKWEAPPPPRNDLGPDTKAGEGSGGGGGRRGPPGPPRGPEDDITGPGGKGRKIETDLTKATNEELAQDITAIIAPEVKQGVVARWLQGGKDFIHSFETILAPARRLDEKIGAVKPGEKTMLGVEDMMRMTFGSRGRAMQFVRTGIVDAVELKLKNKDTNYFKAFDLVREAGGTNEEFMAYRLAKRTVEKHGQGIETGVDVKKAQEFVLRKENIKKYEEAHQMIQRVHDGVVDYMTDSGLLSPERAEAMRALNQDYIVFRRFFDPDYQPPVPGRNFRIRDPNKKMTGDDRQIVDPLSASIDNIYTQIAMADRNRAILNIKGAIDAYWAKQPKQITHGSRDNAYYTVEELPGFGHNSSRAGVGKILDAEGNPIPERAYPAAEPFLAMREHWGQQHPDTFLFYENGKLMRMRATDPDLALLLRQVNVGGNDPISQAFIKFAGLERTGISAAPDYIFRSVWYGQLAKAVSAEGASPIPYSNMIRAGIALWTKNDIYQEFVSKGGFTAAMSDIDTNYIKRDIRQVLESDSWHNSVANVVKHPLEALRMAQAGLDNMARIALMLDAEKRGYGPEKAAMLARKGHLDYGEGFRMQWLNTYSRMVPFMVTASKDIQQVFHAMKERPLTTLGAASAIYMTPTILNYFVNYLVDKELPEKDRYENIERWVKDIYWVLPPINGVRIKIPRGMGPMGFGFGTMVERMMDYWLEREGGRNSVKFKSIASQVVDQVIPPWMPSLIEPAVDHVTGTTRNFQRRLIPASLESASGYMAYTHDTTETAKALTKVLGPAGYDLVDVSPIVVENYARKWLGTVPIEFAKAIDGFWKERQKPHEGPADTPFLRAFFVRRNMGGQIVQSYYEEFEAFTASKKDMRLAVERGDLSLITEPQMIMAGAQLSLFHRSLREQRAAIEAVYRDPNLTDAEKIKHTDAIATGYVATAQAGLTVMRAVKNVARDPLTRQ